MVKCESFDSTTDPSFAQLVGIALPYQAVVGRRAKSMEITGWKAKLGNRSLRNGREQSGVKDSVQTDWNDAC